MHRHERALRAILGMAIAAKQGPSGRLTKDQTDAIGMWCTQSLSADQDKSSDWLSPSASPTEKKIINDHRSASLAEILEILAKTEQNHDLMSWILHADAKKIDEAAKHAKPSKNGKVPIVTIGIDSSTIREAADEILALRGLCKILVEKLHYGEIKRVSN